MPIKRRQHHQPQKKSSKPAPTEDTLSQIKHTDKGFLGKPPLHMLVYGVPGIGKTSFAAYFPNPVFLIEPLEDGINNLVEWNQCPKPKDILIAADWDEVLEKSHPDYLPVGTQTLILDAIGGFERLCFKHVCAEQYEDDWSKSGFFSYYTGPKTASVEYWPELLGNLHTCRMEGINTIILGHQKTDVFQNPIGADHTQLKPDITNQIAEPSIKNFKAILYYSYEYEVKTPKKDQKKGEKPGKADEDSGSRMLFTSMHPVYTGKNSFGLPPFISAGESPEESYKAFEEEMRRSIAGT